MRESIREADVDTEETEEETNDKSEVDIRRKESEDKLEGEEIEKELENDEREEEPEHEMEDLLCRMFD